ncbi:MAG: polysaccharide deacetylase family protein [Polyangiaceae bacterium]
MNVHVSLHDVSPAFREEVDAAIALCGTFGIKPALLVVPNHHRKAPLEEDGAFASRLRELQADGFELFLHGYFHRSEPTQRSGLSGFFRQRVVSAGEAEFAALNETEGCARLDRGLGLLERLDLRVDGFVAPAWSFSPWLVPALAVRGIRYTEDHLRIYDPSARKVRSSLVLNFATRSVGRLASTVLYCRAARPMAAVLPTRVAIHPGDMRSSVAKSEVRSLLRWAAQRNVVRGPQLFD